MIEGAVIALVAAAIGALAGRVTLRRRPRPVRPVCGCKHHLSFHDPETGRCNQMVTGPANQWDDFGSEIAWDSVQCPCRKYTGPEPLPEYYAREIAS